ncbi:MAG: 1-deoxy-D-xylulose 5-phosphate reductoisomerase [marine bacterium B5-7]|nr:MAG: 1-deoxy-D-xylulose 5-phosphate reductoisomerase [marine bacterium B5-7]
MTIETEIHRKKRICVLGSTGSIGDSTLDVIGRHPERFSVFALSGHRRIDKLVTECLRFEPKYAVVSDDQAAHEVRKQLDANGTQTNVLVGTEALEWVACHDEVDVIVTGIVGAAGLKSTLAAVRAGHQILIANKEPLVMMGHTIVAEARRSGAVIIPLDSEHNAIYQCLPDTFEVGAGSTSGADLNSVRRILLTASGGPFRTLPIEDFPRITPAEAVRHPNWSMGRKISVDSATMMNKGLELIEACVLFGVSPDHVEVVIHPQSVIHSMVEYLDGSVVAQMGSADMRIPIAHGLGWPDRIESGAESLDFFDLARLDFERPDETRFPCLALARRAAEVAGISPIVLNAANEIAVDAFLEGRIGFLDIATTIERTLDTVRGGQYDCIEDVLNIDDISRRRSRQIVDTLIT